MGGELAGEIALTSGKRLAALESMNGLLESPLYMIEVRGSESGA